VRGSTLAAHAFGDGYIDQLVWTPFVRLNVAGVQNEAALRYHT
jgi:hypothetical protein